ncbi:MAG: nucleotidyl transferase AbiEii/AbiGii toxin family protein [Candidatus Aminicenantaceae bacterium]
MFQKLLENIAAELSSQSIPYMIIGGQAVLLYGEPRLTKDIDVTLGVGNEGLELIIKSAKNLNCKLLVSDPKDFVRETMVLPTVHENSGIRIDFIFSFSAYEHQAISNAKQVRIGEHDVSFASLEDLIIHKIIAGRPRDLEDIRSVILKNPDFNSPYIEKWLSEFDKSLDGNFLDLFNKIQNSLGE